MRRRWPEQPTPTPQPTATETTRYAIPASSYEINGQHYEASQFERRQALFNESECESDYYGAKVLRHIPEGEPDNGGNSMFYEPQLVYPFEEPYRPDPLTPGVCGFGTVEQLEPLTIFKVDIQTLTEFCEVYEVMLSKTGVEEIPDTRGTTPGACQTDILSLENLNQR